MSTAWTISEEFAREHARKLRELATVIQAVRDEPEAGFDPVRPEELTRLAVEFEAAVQSNILRENLRASASQGE